MQYATFALKTFADMLGTLDHLLETAINGGIGDDILGAKLAEDMFPFELQLRVAVNQVLLAFNQVGNEALPLEESAYGSLEEARGALASVRSQVEQADAAKWRDGGAPVDLTLPNGVRFIMSSEEDIRAWILPNFYFHVTMAYVLLRNAGLPLGKMDFIPHMARYEVREPQ